jgi:hypothetical protein
MLAKTKESSPFSGWTVSLGLYSQRENGLMQWLRSFRSSGPGPKRNPWRSAASIHPAITCHVRLAEPIAQAPIRSDLSPNHSVPAPK